MLLLCPHHLLSHTSRHGVSASRHLSPAVAAAAAAAAARTNSTTTSTQEQLLHPVVYHPDFQISPIPNDHRFPMPKDHLLFVALQQQGLAWPTPQHTPQAAAATAAGPQLHPHPSSSSSRSGSSGSSTQAPPPTQSQQPLPSAAAAARRRSNVFTPSYPDADTLCLVHDPSYVDAFLSGSISAAAMRRIGLPWSQQLVQRTLIGTGSAVLAARLAASLGVAIMCNGGTHHAHRDHGSGWCIFNDLAVAAKAAQRDAGVGRVLMLDLDVHQGDGTATIFSGDASVFTFSMHCGDQTFPTVVQQSDWDIALPAGTGDEEYLQVLQQTLPVLFDRAQPDLCLYNAGVDVHKDDQLGLLALSNDGIAARDAMVLDACLQAGVPLAAAIGGGYQKDHGHIVARHMHVHRAAASRMQAFADMMQARRA